MVSGGSDQDGGKTNDGPEVWFTRKHGEQKEIEHNKNFETKTRK